MTIIILLIGEEVRLTRQLLKLLIRARGAHSRFESIATSRLFLDVMVPTFITLAPHRALGRSLSFVIAEP
jgi:hypothetical protein